MANQSVEHVPPEFRKTRFHCPTCAALSQMVWVELADPDALWKQVGENGEAASHLTDLWFHGALCVAGGCVAIWMEKRIFYEEGGSRSTPKMLYPTMTRTVAPSPDLPDSAKKLYNEAGNVAAGSTRAAAALLRMCTEDIIKGLSKEQDTEETLHERAGLYQHVEFLRKNDELWPGGVIDTGLDALIFIGNEAVHSTEIRGDDDQRTVEGLFRLVDMITQALITRRREVREFERLIAETSP